MSRVLLTTLPPDILGGVASMARLMAEHLQAQGHAVTVAHYVPRSTGGGLNCGPLGTPAMRRYSCWGGFDAVAVGCRLPALEATYYAPSPRWRELIASHDRHMAVGGNVLPAVPLLAAGVPHLIWAASDVMGDRADRQRAMPAPRRLYDRVVVAPRLRALERAVLAGPGRVMAISRYTLDRLAIASSGGNGLLAIPVDTTALRPPETPPVALLAGTAGRHTDPRKNTRLFLDAIAEGRRRGHPFTARIAGPAGEDLRAHANRLGLGDAVAFLGELDSAGLADFYCSLDLYVIPSRQEGLNITGLEAFACAVPVVSTRCGGPEDYVRDGETGYLCAFSAADMAEKMLRTGADRSHRDRLGAAARAVAETEYGFAAFARALNAHWRQVWPDDVTMEPRDAR